jgi:hypothetical protein
MEGCLLFWHAWLLLTLLMPADSSDSLYLYIPYKALSIYRLPFSLEGSFCLLNTWVIKHSCYFLNKSILTIVTKLDLIWFFKKNNQNNNVLDWLNQPNLIHLTYNHKPDRFYNYDINTSTIKKSSVGLNIS